MRLRTALLPLLAFVLWVCLPLPGFTQTVTCQALPLRTGTAGEQLGCSLAVIASEDIDFIVAGSNLADGPRGIEIEDAGSVTAFTRTSEGLPSSQFAPDAALGDQFGFSVSIDGSTVAVGARFGDAPGARDAGAVYVFGVEESPIKVTAQDAAPEAQFGASVALSGDFLAVGAPQDNARGTASGAVYIFRRVIDSSTEQVRWLQQAKLVSSRTMPFDNFGASLAFSSDTLVVGAPFADGAEGGEGAVHVFMFDSRNPEREFIEVQTLTASDAAAGDQLGFSVALAGSLLAAGARRDDHSGLTDAGSVVLFQRDEAGRWSEIGRVTAGDSAQSGDLFGGAVALSVDQLVVGASRADGDSGAVYLFTRDGGEVFLLGRILPPPGGGGRFGFSVAASRGLAVAGAFAAHGNAGEVSLLDCSAPVPGLTIRLSDGVETVRRGQTVTYRVRIANAPAGTAVRHLLPSQLGQIASCRGERCTPKRGLRTDLLDRGGDAVYTVRGRVRSGAQGRMVYEVQAVPPRGSGASPVGSTDENRILPR